MPPRLLFPRNVGAAILVFWLSDGIRQKVFSSFVGRDCKLHLLLFRVCPVPAIFGSVQFATRFTSGFLGIGRVCISIFGIGLNVSVLPEFATLSFELAVSATVETVTALVWLFFLFR